MILAASLILGACNNENEPTDTRDGVAAVFTTNLTPRVKTRMADAAWEEGDAIGIFSSDEMEHVAAFAGLPTSNQAVDLKYTRTTSPDGWDGGTTAFRFKNPASSDVTFKAYYPWKVGVTSEGTIDIDVADQTAAGQAGFDYLFADKNGEGQPSTGSKTNPTVGFQFTHSMAKVVIKLVADGISVTDLGAMEPVLKGLLSKGSFSLTDGVVAFTANSVADLTLKNQTETPPTTKTSQTFVAIVPPQAKPGKAYLTITTSAGSYLSTDILANALEVGKCYTVTITVKKLELVVESSDITVWGDGGSGTGDAILQ